MNCKSHGARADAGTMGDEPVEGDDRERMHSITVVNAAAWPKPPLSQMLQMTTGSVMFSARESRTARVGRKVYAIRPYDRHGIILPSVVSSAARNLSR